MKIRTAEDARACIAGLVSEADISYHSNDAVQLWRLQLPGGFSLWLHRNGEIFHGSYDAERDSAEVGG